MEALEASSTTSTDSTLSKSLANVSLVEENISEQTLDEFDSCKQKGNELFVAKSYEAANEKYTEAFEKAKDDAQKGAIFHNRGMTYELLNNPELALEEYNKAIELIPKYYKALKRRAKLYIELKEYLKARADLVDMICIEKESKDGMNSVTCEQISTVNQELGRLMAVECIENQFKSPKSARNEDIEFFLQSFICDPVSLIWSGKLVPDIVSNPDLNNRGYGAALKALIDKRYGEIIDLCTDEINNTNSEYLTDAYLLRGTFKYLWGCGKETLDDFEKITEAKFPEVTNKLKSSAALKCALYYSNRTLDKDEVEKWFNKAETLWKGNCDVYHRCAMMLMDEGKYEEGKILLSKAVEVLPEKDYPIFFKTLAIAAGACTPDEEECDKRLSVAVTKFKEMEPYFDSPECYDVYANALLLQGKTVEAEELYDKAVELFPNFPSFRVKKVLARLHNLESSTPDDAYNEFCKALEIDDEYNVVHFHMGIAEINRGNYEKGMQELRRSVELTRNIVDVAERANLIVDYELHYELCKLLNLDPLAK